MKIRLLVLLLPLLVLAACGQNSSRQDGEARKIVLKVSHNGNTMHPFQKGFEKFKEIIESETNGRVEVQIFPNAQLASDEQASQMIMLGTLAAAASSTGGGLAPSVPEAELFNFPFIFRDLPHFYHVLDGPIGERVARTVENKLDCIVLGWWFSGIRNVWNAEKPVKTPDDLKGMKIRVMSSPVLVQSFNTLGAQATPMSFGELYSALQQGVVDGAETDHIDLLYEKFYEVTKYVSLTNHMFLAIGLIFSKKVYDSLPKDIQTIVLKAGRASVEVERDAMEAMTNDALKQLKELGLQFYDVDRKPFRDRVQSVYTENADRVGGLSVIQQVIDDGK